MTRLPLIVLLALAATPALAADPAPVVAAERAFAADGLTLGIRDSFLRHAAPEAIVFAPDVRKVHETFPKRPADQGGPPLIWWPLWAGIAASGDLGFTTGPYTYDGKPGGYYFTVWKQQADGSWRWLFDGGPPSDMSAAPPQGSAPAYLPVSTIRAKAPEAAFAEVTRAEAALAAGAKTDLVAAYGAVLAPEGRVVGSPAAPGNSPEAQAAELATRSPQITFGPPLGGEASAAGDLAWTYGDAAWAGEGQDHHGHYVRIWQRRAKGWVLVFDELLASPLKS